MHTCKAVQAAQATNEHNVENGGTVYLVSSDIFTFSGLLSAANGVPGVRVWAITNTSIIAEVSCHPQRQCLALLAAGLHCVAAAHKPAGSGPRHSCLIMLSIVQQGTSHQWSIGCEHAVPGQGFPNGNLPQLSEPATLYTEALQYPSAEFFDYEDKVVQLEQPSGVALDARDERLRQVSYSNGLLWTCEPMHLM